MRCGGGHGDERGGNIRRAIGRVRRGRDVADGNGHGDAVVGVVSLGDLAVRVDDEQEALALRDYVAGADVYAAPGGQGELRQRRAAEQLRGVRVEDGDDEVALHVALALVDHGHEELATGDRGRRSDDEIRQAATGCGGGGGRAGALRRLRQRDGRQYGRRLRRQIDDHGRLRGRDDERRRVADEVEVRGIDPAVEAGVRREDNAHPLGVGRAAVDLDVALRGERAQHRCAGAGRLPDGRRGLRRARHAGCGRGPAGGTGGGGLGGSDDHGGRARLVAAPQAVGDDEHRRGEAEQSNDGEAGEEKRVLQDGRPGFRAGQPLHAEITRGTPHPYGP